jgi:hypothetical protein
MVWDDAAVDPDPTKYDFAATQEEAAAYVLQSYANAWASGIERYFFFRANDEDMGEYFGLMRNDRSFRPSYVAYQVATTHLLTPTMVTNWSYSNGVRRVTLWGTPRGKVSVLWNQTPDAVAFDYEATLATATKVDQRGATETINAPAGFYGITLPGATANLVTDPDDYFIGGEPYVIIEEDAVPPTDATVNPLPATTYSHTIPVSWSASDDQAGVWGFEVQVQQGGSGSWMDWLGLTDTEDACSAHYASGEHDSLYCFRVRAWDHAGNLSPWSEAQRCTRLNLDREVHLNVETVFGDENGNGNWDVAGGEVTLNDLSFRMIDGSGSDVVAPSCGASWELTTTLRAGTYTMVIEPSGWPSPPPGWLPLRRHIDLAPGAAVWELPEPIIGLLRHRHSSYLPLTTLDG